MIEFFSTLTTHVEVILGFLGSLTALGGLLWKFVVKPFRRLNHSLEALNKDLPVIHSIVNEFRNNGGSTLKDVLDRIQDEMTKSTFMQKSLILESGKSFWQTDQQGRWLWASHRLCELMSMEEEEVLGNGWVAAVHPEDQARVFTEWNAAIAQNRQFRSFFRFMSPDGTVTHIRSSCQPIMSLRSNRIIGFMGRIEEVVGEGEGPNDRIQQ